MFGLPQISVSAAGIATQSSDPRSTIELIETMGVRGITLDATTPSLRPREFSRSARRDLASFLRRCELEFTGLDLWIPPEHFADPLHAQRAIDAVSNACEMSAELASLLSGTSKPIVSVVLPSELSQTDRRALGDSAQRVGATIADHQVVEQPTNPTPGIAIGVDPVMVLMSGKSAGKAITHAGSQLVSARLCDVNAMGRCVVGSPGSKLDLTGYIGALIVASQDWITLDLRQLPDPLIASQRAIEAWTNAGKI